ncbi:LysR family transcriptional regulator [Paraburkholderia sp.]|jgi:DNA-binding transcriptional LysR family regulator|uniref:LysR family transcriptional regulator n=1 Tax=Paraburkholderia sp. TaxID=1926495 RepID=UPI002F426EB2
MNQLASLRIFVKVAESLNFAEAAKQLGISNSVVTRSIATLEQHLSVRLINRTTRRVALTPAGESYFQGCVQVLKQLDSMDETIAFASSQPGGPLRIATCSAYANTELSEVLAAYRAEEPRANFELTVFENLADVAVTEFDVCFSAERRLRDSSLVCRPLARTRDVIVATPAYLSRHPTPNTPEALAHHDVLLASDAPSRYWEFRERERTHRIVVKPIMNPQSPFIVKRAVLAGLGIARLSKSIVQEELAAGTLKSLLGGFTLDGDERTVWILYSGQPHMAVAVRRFVDFVVTRYRENSPRGNLNRPVSANLLQQCSSTADFLSSSIL